MVDAAWTSADSFLSSGPAGLGAMVLGSSGAVGPDAAGPGAPGAASSELLGRPITAEAGRSRQRWWVAFCLLGL